MARPSSKLTDAPFRHTIAGKITSWLLLLATVPLVAATVVVVASVLAVGDRYQSNLVSGSAGLDQGSAGTEVLGPVLIMLALLMATAGAAYLTAQSLARQITEPMGLLRDEAHRLADSELPDLVTSLRSTDGSGEMPAVDLIDIEADAEVAELAHAFNRLRAATVELAASQAIGHSQDLAGVLVNLGRRNQQLIGHQLQFIDELELTESNPVVLSNLFTLDQMATRMRRNAENLLVLAGERVVRRTVRPQPVEDVLRAAASEIEDYTRVEIFDAEPALIQPSVVSDVTHLLAELIENATKFSPQDSPVQVVGRWESADGYTISIVDWGTAMSRLDMAEANSRISRSALSTESPKSSLGLFVVGRLAANHQIDARLVESATRGTTAKVTLPVHCVTPLPRLNVPITGSRLTESPEPQEQNSLWPPPVRPWTSGPLPPVDVTYRESVLPTPEPAAGPSAPTEGSITTGSPPTPPATTSLDQPPPSPEDPLVTAQHSVVDLGDSEHDPTPADDTPPPTPSPTEDPVTDEVDPTSKDVTSEDVTSGDATSEDVTSEDETSEDETEGLPIPPFKPRESRRLADAADAASGPTLATGSSETAIPAEMSKLDPSETKADESAADQAAAEEPESGEPEAGRPGTDQPGTDSPETSEPSVAEQPEPDGPDAKKKSTAETETVADLQLVAPTPPESADGEARAIEIRDQLSRFAKGVAAAKDASGKPEQGDDDDDDDDDGHSVLPFRPRLTTAAAGPESETEEV